MPTPLRPVFIALLASLLAACGGSGGTPPPPLPPDVPAWLDTGPRVMPLGDSITEGWPSTRGGYREALYARFVARDQAVDFVGTLDFHSDGLADKQHDGHPGWTTGQLLTGADRPGEGSAPEWIALVDPDAILLLAGTNDLFHAGCTSRSIADGVEALVDRIRAGAPGAHVLVGTVPPIRYDARFQPIVDGANALLRTELAARAAEDDHVHLVDLAALLTPADLAPDGIHLDPAGAGNGKVADAWLAGLDAIHGLLAPVPTVR